MHFLFTLPATVLYIIFLIVPFVKGILYGFTDWNGIAKKYKYIFFENYVNLFSDNRIRGSISFTLRYSIALLVLTVLVGLGLAILLNRNIKFRGIIRTTYFFPAVLSMIIVGLIFNQIYLHALPGFGKMIGVKAISKNILADSGMAFWGILFVNLWQGLAVPTVLLLAGLQSVPKELLEAASIDGANGIKRFFSITFPYLIPSLNMVVILAFKNGLTSFDYIMAMTGGGPNKTTESVGFLIYKYAFAESKFSYANALAVILFIAIGIVSLIQVKGMSRFEVNE